MTRTYLIHCTSVAGHLLEYLHHLYIGAIGCKDCHFCFVVPHDFQEKKGLFSWPETSNVTFETLEGIVYNVDKLGLLKKSYLKARNLGWYVKRYKPTDVVLLDLISYIPFLPLFVRPSTRISGIIYRVYLYEWKDSKFKKKVEDVAKYLIFSRFDVFHRVFVLNDATASVYLNRLYKSSVFKYLPDPIASQSAYSPKNVRQKYNIGDNKTVYLHPGGMLPYKGTIEILRALDKLDDEELSNLVVIFAGRITPGIKNAFFDFYNRLKNRTHIILKDGFLSFEDLADLFVSCDYVLIPYKVKGQSSGIVGHAAFYNKPVIVAEGGIIGKTVKKWHLGVNIKEPTAKYIMDFISHPRKIDIDGGGYVLTHSVSNFCDIIYGVAE